MSVSTAIKHRPLRNNAAGLLAFLQELTADGLDLRDVYLRCDPVHAMVCGDSVALVMNALSDGSVTHDVVLCVERDDDGDDE